MQKKGLKEVVSDIQCNALLPYIPTVLHFGLEPDSKAHSHVQLWAIHTCTMGNTVHVLTVCVCKKECKQVIKNYSVEGLIELFCCSKGIQPIWKAF